MRQLVQEATEDEQEFCTEVIVTMQNGVKCAFEMEEGVWSDENLVGCELIRERNR